MMFSVTYGLSVRLLTESKLFKWHLSVPNPTAGVLPYRACAPNPHDPRYIGEKPHSGLTDNAAEVTCPACQKILEK